MPVQGFQVDTIHASKKTNWEEGLTRATRIGALDGFRALAILLVMGFHYYGNPSQFQNVEMLYPYGTRFVDMPLVKYGYLGVDLFFIISGFVIAMTLETSRNAFEFATKRLARLFPAMLLCTFITFFGLDLLPQQVWHLNPVDLLPGLTFISDFTWRGWLGPHVAIVEIVYWTLFVEVKFYIFAAIVFFCLRRVPLLVSMAALLNLAWVVIHLPRMDGALVKAILIYDYLPWFLTGVAFRYLSEGRMTRLALFVIAECLLMLVMRMLKGDRIEIVWTLLFFALFFALVYRPQWLRWASWRPLTLIGVSSYSLYLLHNRLGISLTHALAGHLPEWLWPVIPEFVGAALVGLAFAVHRWWERPVQSQLLKRLVARRRMPDVPAAAADPVAVR